MSNIKATVPLLHVRKTLQQLVKVIISDCIQKVNKSGMETWRVNESAYSRLVFIKLLHRSDSFE